MPTPLLCIKKKIAKSVSPRKIGYPYRIKMSEETAVDNPESRKRTRESEDDAESKGTERPLVSGSVKRRVAKLLDWIRDPDNAKDFGFHPQKEAIDLLMRISELPDERKISNPNVDLESTEGGHGEWDDKHGQLMLSEFLTLYAAGHVHRFPELPKIFRLQENIPDLNMKCDFGTLEPQSIYERGHEKDPSRYSCGRDDFEWEKILDGMDIHLRHACFDFEYLVRRKILDVRDPFFPGETPLEKLKAEAAALWPEVEKKWKSEKAEATARHAEWKKEWEKKWNRKLSKPTEKEEEGKETSD